MDPITKALKDGLDSKTLSRKTKQEILTAKPRKKRNFTPQIVAICICAVALFLLITNEEKTPPQMATANALLGSVDEAALNYFNREVPKLQMDRKKREDLIHNGDAYLMRLALEQNSSLFYSESSLSVEERFLVSELLHIVQEVVWQNEIWTRIDPIQSIDELAQQAPALIAKLEPYVAMPYISIKDEKKYQWDLYSFDQKRWISYVVVLVLLVLGIIYLFKNNHRIIGSLVIFLAFVSFMQPFTKPFKEYAAYDEQTLVEVVARELKKENVRVVGEPQLQYAASIHETRSALVSYEDGMSVIAIFKYKQGQYIKESLLWHTGTIFNDSTFENAFEYGEKKSILVSALGFKPEHDVATFRVMSENKQIAETMLTEGKPTIIYLKKPTSLSSMEYHFLDEKGEVVQ